MQQNSGGGTPGPLAITKQTPFSLAVVLVMLTAVAGAAAQYMQVSGKLEQNRILATENREATRGLVDDMQQVLVRLERFAPREDVRQLREQMRALETRIQQLER